MFEEIKIEKELRNLAKKIFLRIPKNLQKNKYVLETAMFYLKIGGEKLALQAVEVFKTTNNIEKAQRKKKLRDEALLRAAEVRKTKETPS